MIEKADINLTGVISLFSDYKISAAYLVPTPTAMEKSIMDATAPVRAYLRENGIHDFDKQAQGTENKKILHAELINGNKSIPVKVSLYRPETKLGDPRIWIYELGKHAKACNLLALIVFDGKLYIVNTSNPDTLKTITDPKSPLGFIASRLTETISAIAAELLDMLRERTGDKFIASVRAGDTGIGATLEHVLGIQCNNNQTPDYKGIEIKASRHARGGRARNRVNLFSQVPDWKNSPSNAFSILTNYGYVINNRLQLYCTLDARKPNPQTLMLDMSEEEWLKTISVAGDTKKALMVWAMSKLKDRLEEKHPESFWVKADTTRINGIEYFKYYKVIHTIKPMVSNLPYLLGDGTITLDLTMSRRSPTSKGVDDHGYLFKLLPRNFHTLFPTPIEHDLYIKP